MPIIFLYEPTYTETAKNTKKTTYMMTRVDNMIKYGNGRNRELRIPNSRFLKPH